MLRRVILLLMIAIGVDIFDVHQCGAQQITMDFDTDCRSSMNRGMAGYRQCIYDNRLRQIEQMSAKTCSKQKCYFKLSFAGRIRQSMAEPENADTSYINIFKGAEFSFVDGQAFATGDAEFPYGRLLIDEKASRRYSDSAPEMAARTSTTCVAGIAGQECTALWVGLSACRLGIRASAVNSS